MFSCHVFSGEFLCFHVQLYPFPYTELILNHIYSPQFPAKNRKLSQELLNFKTKTMPFPLPNWVVNIGQDAQWNVNKHSVFLEIFDFDYLSQNGSSKMAPFWHQNLLIYFLICLNLIVVLLKVKVNRLSISWRSL